MLATWSSHLAIFFLLHLTLNSLNCISLFHNYRHNFMNTVREMRLGDVLSLLSAEYDACRISRPRISARPPAVQLSGGKVLLPTGYKYVFRGKLKLNIKTTQPTPRYQQYKFRLFSPWAVKVEGWKKVTHYLAFPPATHIHRLDGLLVQLVYSKQTN